VQDSKMQRFVIMVVVARDILDICNECKCSQHCGITIHVNSKLGFLNGLCWIEEVPQTIYGKCLGLWGLWVYCMVQTNLMLLHYFLKRLHFCSGHVSMVF
jgi:hypothetical protein